MLSIYDDPCCMNCHVKWLYQFLTQHFSKTFLGGAYKKHREDVLFDREISMLPSTVQYAEKHRAISEARQKLNNLKTEYRKKTYHLYELREKICSTKKLLRDLEKNYRVENKNIVGSCPVNNCRGFLNTSYECELCKIRVCSACHEVVVEDHECMPENLETIQLLKQDTKACPKCASMIFKIDGCDQMFCTQCHTAFGWNSGIIATGNIHNPHYFEWQHLTTKEPQIVVSHENPELMKILRGLKYIRNVILPKYNVPIHFFDVNLDIRIEYLLNQIDKNTLKKMLQSREKLRRKKTNVREIFVTVYKTGYDLICRDAGELEFEALRQYVNECLKSVSKSYNSQCITINEEWIVL